MANKRRKDRGLLAAQTASLNDSQSSSLIAVWRINTIIGVFLLPVVWILTQTFFTCLGRETIRHEFWATEEFRFFALGAAIWLIIFFRLSRPVIVYVFGHELTHAVWVWIMGGRVRKFKCGSDGGYILTDKQNVWIALAPYFYPIYSMVVLVAYEVAAMFVEVQLYHRLFFGLLGFTWAFHISFTVWMIPKGQTDLTYHGTFYSLVLIYIMNLAILSILLILGSSHVTWLGFGQQLFENTVDFSAWICALVQRGIAGLWPTN